MDARIEDVAENRDTVEHQAAEAEGAGEATKLEKARKIAFIGLVVLYGLFILATFNLVFLMIVISWLPDATYMGIIGETDPAFLTHRVHDSILPVFVWSMLVGTVVQLRRPEKRIAPLLMLLAFPVAFTVVEVATGTFVVMESVPFAGGLLLALLHPRARELVRFRGFDNVMMGLSALAAAVWVPFAYGQAQLQMLGIQGDTHAAQEHWSRMAVFALLVVIWAVIGSSDRPGWRLTAWVAGLASVWYGFQSLLFPVASAAALPWSIAAIAWGAAFVVAAERRVRSAQPAPAEKAVAGQGQAG